MPLAKPKEIDGFFGIQYDLCYRLSARKAKEQGRSHGKPVTMRADRGHGGVALGVSLAAGGGRRYHTKYHRLVALTLLRCHWGSRGALLARPHTVAPEQYSEYEVHHRDGCTRNCSLSNLVVLPRQLHRLVHDEGVPLKRPPCGWGK